MVALNTMYKKTPQKQYTYRTPKGAEKQLDYILVNKTYYKWSRDAEVNNMIHMGSDHRCVMARLVIALKSAKKPMNNEGSPNRIHERPRCEKRAGRVLGMKAEFEARYQDFEEEIKKKQSKR